MFSRRKNKEFFEMLERENENYKSVSERTVTPQRSLTPDEILTQHGGEQSGTGVSGISPLESLKDRMLSAKADPNPQSDIKEGEGQPDDAAPAHEEPATDSRPEKVQESQPEKPQDSQPEKPQDSQPEKVQDDGAAMAPELSETHKKTLLEKCKPYVTDDEGRDVSAQEPPLYRLESVAEILKSDSEKALKALSKKYEVSVDDLGRGESPAQAPVREKKKPDKLPETVTEEEAPATDDAQSGDLRPKTAFHPRRTQAFKKMVADSGDTAEREIFEELFPGGVTVGETGYSLPDISDIDDEVSERSQLDTPQENATIRFTPVKDSGGAGHISVSSQTRTVDLTGELGELENDGVPLSGETRLEETEFESFEPREEYRSPSDAKQLIRSLSIRKRNAFLRSGISLLSVIALVILRFLPPLSDLLIQRTRTAMIVAGCALALSTLANLDMLSGFARIFSRRCPADVPAALATVGTLALCGAAIQKRESACEIILLCAVILLIRALSVFWECSSTLGGLKQIAVSKPKRAVNLITDEATAFAMAKNAVEGDALIAAPRSAEHIADFMKYTRFGVILSGRLAAVAWVSAALAVVTGLAAAAYFGNMLQGLYTAASILCIAAAPPLFFIDALPLYCAAARLNRKGAMIAGKAAAERLELANAAVISSNDIFPDGAVTMHSMKVLGENSIDDILLRATSLTDAVGSTLAPIFKRITGTDSSYSIPASETVKYEERLGLSGWVDNELLFVGNRTLMEAHGIEVPSVELDRKILRRGYFPVYLASGGKACALIIIQYSVDPLIARELRRVTDLGVTLLVDNCDPNITEEMICDYIGLYGDSVRIMSNAGVHMYKNAVTPAESCSAPAAFRSGAITFISIINCASRIKRSGTLLTVIYALTACIGAVLFAYISFSGSGAPPQGVTVLLYELAATVLSLLAFLALKP